MSEPLEGDAVRRAEGGLMDRHAEPEPWRIERRDLLRTLERQQDECRALHASEQSLRLTLEAARIGHWELDLASHAASRSAQHDRIFGYATPEAEWTYERFLNHVVPPDRVRVDQLFQSGLAAQGDCDFECRIRRADGAERWIWVHGRVLPGERGEAARMTGMVADVTERKRAEERLAWLASFPDSAPTPIVEIDLADGAVHYMNRAAVEQFPGLPLEGLNHPLIAGMSEIAAQLVEAGRLRREIVAGTLHLSQVMTHVGGESRVRVYSTDVTEQRMAEGALSEKGELLRASDRRLAEIVHGMTEACFALDQQWRFTFVNDRSESLFHRRRAEMLGRSIWEVFEDLGGTPLEALYRHAMADRVPVSVEAWAPVAARWLDIRLCPTPEGLAAFLLDIDVRKRAEGALRESEEHFRFLNDLGEATRDLGNAGEIMQVTALMLGSRLGASRCAYAGVESDGERFTIVHDYTNGCASTVGTYALSSFGPLAVSTLQDGRTLVVRNVDGELRPAEGADMFNAIGIKSIVCCPLVRDGRLRAMMAVHQIAPRNWTAVEIATVEDVVGRCWATIERHAAEESLHELNATLEQHVNERTAQLESANAELEAFSYSVSHDLRAPLRAVDGFAQAVEEDYGELLPAEGQRFLRTIRDGAQRMGGLIDDLLTLSRLSRLPLTRQDVDTTRLVRGILDDLLGGHGHDAADVRLDELPPCAADPVLLKQAWVNLLSNAFKYSSRRPHPVIEIGARQEPGGTVYFVRDNGTGFDMRYAGKLFGVFQRLHRQEEFEGTGVGLAIVQRIVHRHGGRVWAEAAPDQGATFQFSLGGNTP